MHRFRLVVMAAIMLALFAGLRTNGVTAQDAPPAPSVGAAAQPDGTLAGNPQVQLVQVASGLADPVNIANAGDGSGRLFVVERPGLIHIIQDGQVLPEPFLDIQSSVKSDFLEQGLLGLAFDPDYATNGRFFVYYADYSSNGALTLAEFHVSADDPNKADSAPVAILFSIADPYINHNGGTLEFGPDGYLYLSIGDGGLAGDPYDNAQDLSKFFGKILRIDVHSDQKPYGIPADNPFALAGQVLPSSLAGEPGRYHPDGAPEVWAYGLRNPWQFSFDSETGDLFIADVGQNFWEEINVIPAGQGGVNLGWDHLEATHCYPADVTECQVYGQLPVAEYDHAEGSCSITGIGMYRSDVSPTLDGIYFNSDYCSGNVWGLQQDATSGDWVYQQLLDTDLLVTGSGDGEDGQLYVTSCECTYDRAYNPIESASGAVWVLVSADQVPADAVVAPVATVEATPVP